MKDNRNDVVIIQLDEPRTLRLGHKAMKTMEKLLGVSVSDFSLENITSEEIEKVMYCLLLDDYTQKRQTLNLEMMEELLDKAEPYSEVVNSIAAAFSAAFPAPDPNAQRTAAAGTGKKATAKPSK